MTMRRLLFGLGAATVGLAVVTGVMIWRAVPRGRYPYASAQKTGVSVLLSSPPERVQLDQSGGTWQVLTSSGPRTADSKKVETLLGSLEDLRLDDVISYQAERHGEFDVTVEKGTRIELRAAGGTLMADGIVGKQAPDFSHLYFRFADRPEVYLASGMFRGEISPGRAEDWIGIETSTAPALSR